MSLIASALKHMLAAGMTHDAIVAAVEDMEATLKPEKSARSARNARYYDANREELRLKASEQRLNRLNATEPTEPSDGDPAPCPDKEKSPEPSKENNPYPEENPSPAKAGSAPLSDEKSISAALAAYNQIALTAGWPKVIKLTTKRRMQLRGRLVDAGGVDGWRQALLAGSRAPFLTGSNDRGWRADIDFFLRQDKFLKTLEGGYGDSTNQRPNSNGTEYPRSAADQVISSTRRRLARLDPDGRETVEGGFDFQGDARPDAGLGRSVVIDNDGQEVGSRRDDSGFSTLFLPSASRFVGSH